MRKHFLQNVVGSQAKIVLNGLLSPRHEHIEIPLNQFARGVVNVFAEIKVTNYIFHKKKLFVKHFLFGK